MSENDCGMWWLFTAIIIGCIAYINYGTFGAVAGYVLFNMIAGVCVLLSFVPFVGIFIYWNVATYIGTGILAYVGLSPNSLLFTAILVSNGIFAFIVCLFTTLWVIWKIAERI